MASSSFTTSSISGRLSGFGSQHLFMIFATACGQHFGISDRERERNPMNNGVRDLSKTTVSIGHVTAVYFPEAYPKAIDIAFPVVRLSFKNLCNKS
ncbi:unnamed protein product [Arabidopsis thaliana]|uniref:Uncharacterized protein n=1 Tax=Arabidopsis thaliana TaxID=3702 RepID=A0A654FKB4_ARATH|nr:unnamed protein product [Arabidopsis thaliana]